MKEHPKAREPIESIFSSASWMCDFLVQPVALGTVRIKPRFAGAHTAGLASKLWQCGQAQPGGENGARVTPELFMLSFASHIGTFLGPLRARHGRLVHGPRSRWATPTAFFMTFMKKSTLVPNVGAWSHLDIELRARALARRDEAQTPRTDFVIPLTS